jgi:DNA-binding MarR family transcriptional regulator
MPGKINGGRSPGFLVRRLQQVSVAIFRRELEEFGITPIQYTILTIVRDGRGREGDGIDQQAIATRAVLDASTIADVLRRLEAKGLISRKTGPKDKRTRIVRLSPGGDAMLVAIAPNVQNARRKFLAPLNDAERNRFLSTVERLVGAHEGGSTDNAPWSRVSAGQPA